MFMLLGGLGRESLKRRPGRDCHSVGACGSPEGEGLRWAARARAPPGRRAEDPTPGRAEVWKLLPLKLVIEKRDGLAGMVVL